MTPDTDSQGQLDYCVIESAWWKWVDEQCPFSSPRARGKWMNNNEFTFSGTKWKRFSNPMISNSGKSIVHRAIYFVAEDGRKLGIEPALFVNRRNDPKRNWGLGPD
jgi:hypothetical protein